MTGSQNFEMDVVKNQVFFSLKYKYEVSPHFISTNSLHTLADRVRVKPIILILILIKSQQE